MSNEPDKVNSGALATLVALLALAMLGASLTITALVRAEEGEVGAERALPGQNPYRNMRAEQQAELNASPAWSDRAKGLVSLPIDKAEKLMLGDIRRGHTWVGELPPKQEGLGGASGAEEQAPADKTAPGADQSPTPGGAGTATPPLSPVPGSTGPSPVPPKAPAPTKAPEAPAPKKAPSAPAPEAPKP
jgi:hypothetical protein